MSRAGSQQVSKKELGERLRAVRHSHGVTQSQVAKILGTNQSHVSNVERGARGLTLQQVVKLTRAFDVSADTLLNGKKPAKPARSLKSGRLLQRLQRIEELPPTQQKAILKILDGLLGKHARG